MCTSAGADEVLAADYAGLVGSTKAGFDVTLTVDASGDLPMDKGELDGVGVGVLLLMLFPPCGLFAAACSFVRPEELVEKIACLPRNLIGAPIILCVFFLFLFLFSPIAHHN